MVVTKSSWKYDSKTGRYISGAQGGGYVEYNPESGRYERYTGGWKSVAQYTPEKFQSMVGKGLRAEKSYSEQRLLQKQRERGVEGIERVTSDKGTSLVKVSPQKEGVLKTRQQIQQAQKIAEMEQRASFIGRKQYTAAREQQIRQQEQTFMRRERYKVGQEAVLADPSWQSVFKKTGIEEAEPGAGYYTTRVQRGGKVYSKTPKGLYERAETFVARPAQKYGLFSGEPVQQMLTESKVRRQVLRQSEQSLRKERGIVPLVKRTIAKEFIRAEDTAPFYFGVEAGARQQLRERPIKTAGLFVAGFALPQAYAGAKFLTTGTKVQKIASTSKLLKGTGAAVRYGVPTLYAAEKVTRVVTAPSRFERGRVVGQTLTETTALVAGAKLSTPLTRRISRATETKKLRQFELKMKKVGTKPTVEWRQEFTRERPPKPWEETLLKSKDISGATKDLIRTRIGQRTQYGIPTQKGVQLQLIPKDIKPPAASRQLPLQIAKGRAPPGGGVREYLGVYMRRLKPLPTTPRYIIKPSTQLTLRATPKFTNLKVRGVNLMFDTAPYKYPPTGEGVKLIDRVLLKAVSKKFPVFQTGELIQQPKTIPFTSRPTQLEIPSPVTTFGGTRIRTGLPTSRVPTEALLPSLAQERRIELRFEPLYRQTNLPVYQQIPITLPTQTPTSRTAQATAQIPALATTQLTVQTPTEILIPGIPSVSTTVTPRPPKIPPPTKTPPPIFDLDLPERVIRRRRVTPRKQPRLMRGYAPSLWRPTVEVSAAKFPSVIKSLGRTPVGISPKPFIRVKSKKKKKKKRR